MRTCGRILFVSTISALGFFVLFICFYVLGRDVEMLTGRQIKGGRNRDRESKSETKARSTHAHSLPQ